MKIEIDLDDILGDEYGTETMQESIRRQVIDGITSTLKTGVLKKIDLAVDQMIGSEITDALKARMPALIDDVMNAEYIPVTSWGERGKPTTFRSALVAKVNEEMVYKKANYESDKNTFTKAVDAVVGENVKKFKEEFNKKIDADFTNEALAYAADALKKRLGIKS